MHSVRHLQSLNSDAFSPFTPRQVGVSVFQILVKRTCSISDTVHQLPTPSMRRADDVAYDAQTCAESAAS